MAAWERVLAAAAARRLGEWSSSLRAPSHSRESRGVHGGHDWLGNGTAAEAMAHFWPTCEPIRPIFEPFARSPDLAATRAAPSGRRART
eukprot:7373773-Pyramimonas_sp.AAC.1